MKRNRSSSYARSGDEGWSVENRARWSDRQHEFNIFIRADVNVYNLFDSAGLTEGDPRLASDVDPTELPEFLNARPILPRRVKVSMTYTF